MARSLIDTASHDPDTLKMLSQAFDEVWREIAANYHAEAMIEDRRNRLATIILGLADGGERDLLRMKTCASKLMAQALQATSSEQGKAPRRRLTHRTMSGLQF
jgi:hypothetical protein